MEALDRLVEVIEEIAKGNYSNDIMPLTTEDQPEPLRTIAESMGMMMVRVEAREYRLRLLVDELKELNEKIRENVIKTVATMAHALAARDVYTEGHAARVGALSARMARFMGLDNDSVETIRIAGVLHDIGKIGFSDRLFQAHPNRNPSDIVEEIVRHPDTGAEILRDLDFLGPALDYIRCHHERPDGKGYPRRLKGKDLPLGARILSVADAYDAMTTDRPYQKKKVPEEALRILKTYAGAKWDEGCVAALEAFLADKGVSGPRKAE